MPSHSASLILLDILIYCFIAVTIAMPIYYFIRRKYPDLEWNQRGRISISHITQRDILGISLAMALPLATILRLPFLSDEQLQEASEGGSMLTKLIEGTVGQLMIAVIPLLFIGHQTNIIEAFSLKSFEKKHVIISVIIGMLAIYFFVPITDMLIEPFLKSIGEGSDPQEAVTQLLEAKDSNPLILIGFVLLTCIIAPICEEILFRGYLYTILKKYSSRLFAALISGLIFGLIHASLTSLAPLVIVGIILAFVYEYSGSLWGSILCHATFNTINVLVMIFLIDASDLAL